MYKQISDSNARLNAQSQGRQMYIDHITIQVQNIVHESRKIAEKGQALIREYYPTGDLGQCLQNFLEEAGGQYEYIMSFYEANFDVLNF